MDDEKKELKENLKKLLKKKFKKPVIFYIFKKAIEILTKEINEATNPSKNLNTRINEATNPNKIFNVSDNTENAINLAIASNYYIETSSEETKVETDKIRVLFNNLITNKNTLSTATIGEKIDEIIDNKQTTQEEFESLFPNFSIPKKTNNNNRTKKGKRNN